MATTALPLTDESEQLPGLEPDQDDFEDQGTGGPFLGLWNELLEEDLQNVLKKLVEKYVDQFRYPRRLEVMKAWRARSFWRELQHLSWNWEGAAWDVLGPAGTEDGQNPTDANKDSAVLYTTNVYQGFGESFIAVVTQATPALRFEPEDSEEAADIDTASIADDFRRLAQHENDPIKLMTKAAFYAWTDGRMHGWTRWAIDKRTGKSRETQSVHGVMEVKVPVIHEEMCDYAYLIYSDEYQLATVRAKVKDRQFEDPNYYKKVKAGASGGGQEVWERTARISVKQGITMKSAGGDAYGDLVTTTRAWMRPEVLLDDTVTDEQRASLEPLFPNGIYVETDNGLYTGSRNASMDDEWAIENVMEGDGANRPGKGTCLISVQERVNDDINVFQDIVEKTSPASHWDRDMFNVDAMRRQVSTPGARYSLKQRATVESGDAISNHVFFEPATVIEPGQFQYVKELMTDVPEFLTGISAILFGSDSQGDKSGKALSIQQAAAMGRIGLAFRVMKRFYARMMEQAIRCAARNRTEDFVMGIPDENGQIETVAVRTESLNGKVRCYPDSDENLPESITQKRQLLLTLMEQAEADPVMLAVFHSPGNQALIKRYLGMSELELPDADSWNKQLSEINKLLASQPVQPPPLELPNPLTGDQEQIQPPLTSSVPIDKDYDNHSAEFLTVTIWINGRKGQKAKITNPNGFQNVRLHGLMHKAVLDAAMAAQAAAAAPPKPPGGEGGPPKEGGKEGEGDKNKPDIKVEHKLAA